MARKTAFTRTGLVFSFEPGIKERQGPGGLRVKSESPSKKGRFRLTRTDFAPKDSNNTILMKLSLQDSASGPTPVDEVFIEEPADLLVRAQEAQLFIDEQATDLNPPVETFKSRSKGDIIFSGRGAIISPREVTRRLKEDDFRATSSKGRQAERAKLQRLQNLNEEFLLQHPELQERLRELKARLDKGKG